MVIFHHISQISSYLKQKRLGGDKIGFVPTMGALHLGHLSLVKQSKIQTELTVCSIFVNPTQFNDPADFEKYPVTINQDIELLVNVGCDVLFLPAVNEIYPEGKVSPPHYELGYLETVLEGKYRPGHFQGVCQVVDILLRIVQPDELFMGQKDFQQCMVVKKLIEINGMNTRLNISSTLREKDGLAMSSRNLRLSNSERENAVSIYQTLLLMKEQLQAGDVLSVEKTATQYLTTRGFRVDYTALANAGTLELISNWNGKDDVVALIAAYLNDVRLIDNMIITE